MLLTLSERNEKWVKEEGGIEHPTRKETLEKPEQKKRIQWLKEHVTGKVLDVGCNWGYVSNEIGACAGIDINPENIKMAEREFPEIEFSVGNAYAMPFEDKSCDTVVLADILEHIPLRRVSDVLEEAERCASKKILITLPAMQTEDCALCFKHKWIPSEPENLGVVVLDILYSLGNITLVCDIHFIYIEVDVA